MKIRLSFNDNIGCSDGLEDLVVTRFDVNILEYFLI